MEAETPRAHHEASHPAQLRLLETSESPDWRLDDTTKEVGLRGIAAARAALRSARRRTSTDEAEHDHSTAA